MFGMTVFTSNILFIVILNAEQRSEESPFPSVLKIPLFVGITLDCHFESSNKLITLSFRETLLYSQ